MPLLLDVFNDDAFSTVELARSINVIPNQFGRIGELNVFPDQGIPTTNVAIEENLGVIHLLPTSRRGAPGTAGVRGKRRVRNLSTVHIPHDSQLTADDLRNLRGEDGQISLATAQTKISQEQTNHRRKQDITREHLRAGALRGEIVDADGSVILNLFDEFGVTEKAFDFDLGTAGTDVRDIARAALTHLNLNLKGDMRTGARALCSESFFSKLIQHESVKRAWDNFQGRSDALASDVLGGFPFGGIVWEQYEGTAEQLNEDGTVTVRKFIADGDCRIFPTGTQQSFATFNAPSDFMEDLGQAGQPFYMKLAPDQRFNRFVDIHSQQNPLPICMRPALLVRGFTST